MLAQSTGIFRLPVALASIRRISAGSISAAMVSDGIFSGVQENTGGHNGGWTEETVATPEPGSLLSLAAGLGLLAMFSLRNKQLAQATRKRHCNCPESRKPCLGVRKVVSATPFSRRKTSGLNKMKRTPSNR
jgi:hypothetical protein